MCADSKIFADADSYFTYCAKADSFFLISYVVIDTHVVNFTEFTTNIIYMMLQICIYVANYKTCLLNLQIVYLSTASYTE